MGELMYRLFAGFIFLCSATVASADMTERFDGGSDDWTGVYVGGLLGYGEVNDFNGLIKDHGEGELFGAIIGYNYQLDNNIVVGFEADWSRYDISFEKAPTICFENSGTFRGHVGYAHNDIMFYASAGMSYATTNIDLADTGLVIGAGIDYKLTDNIIFGVEYQHSMYRNFDNTPIEADFDLVRARLLYKFP